MLEAVKVLLRSVIDYAGTFPPAKLKLPDALANYGRARAGAQAWMLGRCIFAAAQLKDFERLAPPLVGGSQDPPLHGEDPPLHAEPWPLSLIATGDPAELEQVQRFNAEWRGRAMVVALEFQPLDVHQMNQVARSMPKDVEAFFELPFDAGFDARLAAIARHGAFAKIRTGGIVADAFPGADDLVRGMRACADAKVALKASAGLHHAVCGRYALTYEPDSALASMYGFLNICVAAALVHLGAAAEAVEALRETSARAFTFTAQGLRWRTRSIALADLASMRQHLFRSFGSCAFTEPVEDLERLGLL